MRNVTPLRGPSEPESCVVGDHVYLVLSHADLVDVVDALQCSGESALEQRLARLLRSMPTATDGKVRPRCRLARVPETGPSRLYSPRRAAEK